jgi:recombination protein RecA
MKEKVKEKEKMSTEKEAKLKALQLTLDKLDKTRKGNCYENGDRAIVEVETSWVLGIDLALGVGGTQEEELLKYTAQNPLERLH